MDFQIEVNKRVIDVTEGETLLSALRRNGFRIPTLCHMNRFSPTGACRLCVVEVEGKRDLITSCSYPVEHGMKVLTNSQRVIKARKTLVEMLLSNHPDDCLYCQRNGNCELQWLAEEMNVKERKYFGEKQKYFPDHSGSSVARDPAKCILCSRCVRMCEEVQLVTAIDFIQRSNKTTVNSAFYKGLNTSSCISCGQCITVCPTAALLEISHLEKVQAAIDDKKRKVIFLLSPSVVASIAEEFGLKSEKGLPGLIAAALRRCGADLVYDLGFACDVNILEESKLLLEKVQQQQGMPLLSACCPAWVRYVQVFRPEWLPMLSGVKSPQQMLGAMIKFDRETRPRSEAEKLYCVSVTSCVANKYEATTEEMTHKGISEIDAVLSVRECIRMIRTNGIDIRNMESERMDTPYGRSSSLAWKTGYSGGKAEAVACEAHKLSKGKNEAFRFVMPKNLSARKESKLKMNGHTVGFSWVSGIAAADAYVDSIIGQGRKDIHYIEVMACPGGCVGGGGQPINRLPEKPRNRKKICQEMEKHAESKTASEVAGKQR